MPITINYFQFSERVSSKSLILTPNARTQKAIVAGYMAELKEGEVVYAPNIKSYSQWIAELWDELSFVVPLPGLIGKLELKAWLQATIAQEDQWQLTNELGVAEKVLDAYQTLTQWGLRTSDIAETETIENRYFITWIETLEDFLSDKNLLPQFAQFYWLNNQWEGELSETLNQVFLSLPIDNILLVGFDQLTPVEQKFLDLYLERRNEAGSQQALPFTIETFYPSRQVARANRVELTSLQQEIEFAARLSLQFTQQDPQASVGVVVHQLASHLDMVHQSFSDYFQPEELDPWQPLQKINYNVSAGQVLLELPMIVVAMQLLNLNSSGFDLQTLLMLKNTPFIHWGENANSIRRFLHLQSLLSYSHYSVDRLLMEIDQYPQAQQLNLLRDRISALKLRENRAKPMTAWVDYWNSCLRNWGWLAERELDDSETKQLDEFNTAMSATLKLNKIYPVCSLSQSREFLQQTLRQSVFQTPSDRTNVHVLGVLEATGLEFDELILVGFSRENWPQKAKLNPFLPKAFQKLHNMRGSSAEREFIYAKQISNSLIHSSTNLCVTQVQSADGENFSGSAFFSDLPLSDFQDYLALPEKQHVHSEYVWKTDEKIDIHNEVIRGGAYLLSQYATCPFKALTTFQLKLQAAQSPQQGIDARIKGAWLHYAMELLWKALKNQQAMLVLSEVQLIELINTQVTVAQTHFESRLLASAALPIIQLEHEKLVKQIVEWMSLEKQRTPFSVQTEVEKSLSLGTLELNLRIDRIDTNAAGELEIIDYKSGATQVKKWLGSRPEEAQMPAYVLACASEKIASLSYAQIRTGATLRSGVIFDQSDDRNTQWFETSLEKHKDTTRYVLSDPASLKQDESVVQQWRNNLENLAEKITHGIMPVSPKHLIDSCRYCDYSDVCRISEKQPDVDSINNPLICTNESLAQGDL